MVRVSRKRIEFRYSLSDLRLYRVGFNAVVAEVPFDPKAKPLALPLDVPEIPADVDLIVHAGQHINSQVPKVRATSSAICYIRNQTINHYIDLQESFADYLKGFSSKSRSTLQRKVRKFPASDDGKVDLREYSTPESVLEFQRLARQVAVKTYQEKLFGGAIPGTPEFAEHMRELARNNCFRGFLLFIKKEPVSYLYVPASGDVLEYGFLGYDPAHANLSPGTVLLYFALEKLFAERRFHYFNFTYGEGQTKELFGRGNFLQADVYYFRRTLRNSLAVHGHVAMERLSTALGKGLEVLGLRQRIRKLLRRSKA